jgi:hypothetical protein
MCRNEETAGVGDKKTAADSADTWLTWEEISADWSYCQTLMQEQKSSQQPII